MVELSSAREETARCESRFLYELLTDVDLHRRRVPIVVALNKTELTTARSEAEVKTALEQELCVDVCCHSLLDR
jgi:signal recognition particle receptor subunit beta